MSTEKRKYWQKDAFFKDPLQRGGGATPHANESSPRSNTTARETGEEYVENSPLLSKIKTIHHLLRKLFLSNLSAINHGLWSINTKSTALIFKTDGYEISIIERKRRGGYPTYVVSIYSAKDSDQEYQLKYHKSGYRYKIIRTKGGDKLDSSKEKHLEIMENDTNILKFIHNIESLFDRS